MSATRRCLLSCDTILVDPHLVDPHLVDRIWSIPIWSTSPFGRSQFGRSQFGRPPHNRGIGKFNMVSIDELRQRYQAAAFSMTNQIILFGVEILGLLLMTTSTFIPGIRHLVPILKVLEFGIISFITVVISPELRKHQTNLGIFSFLTSTDYLQHAWI